MIRGKVGFAKKRKHLRSRMGAANLRNLRRGMAITRSDLAHVAARLQVNPINRASESARLPQQADKRLPVVAPFIVIAKRGAKFLLTDFAAGPIVQYQLIAAEDHFQRQHNRPPALYK